MTTFARAENGDIIIENGQIKMVNGLEAYRVVLQAAVLTLVGELQLDTDYGVPHMESILGKNGKDALWHDRMQKIITGFPFVRSVGNLSMSINYAEKKLTYSMSIITDLGVVELSR